MEYRIITLRGKCEEERERLLNVPNEPDFKKWLAGRSWPLEWMKNQFGPTLKEKDGFIHGDGVSRVSNADCSICGHHSEPDQKIIEIEDYDAEYDCDHVVCRICLRCLEKFISEITHDE